MAEDIRAQIAQDVLEHLKAKRIKAQPERYFTLWDDDGQGIGIPKNFNEADEWFKNLWGKQLQPALHELQRPCNVCALGSLLYANVYKDNDFIIREGVNAGGLGRSTVTRKLKQYFQPHQLDLIEVAFEIDASMARPNSPEEEEELFLAEDFGSRYDNPEQRLEAIMNNIILNEGVFIP